MFTIFIQCCYYRAFDTYLVSGIIIRINIVTWEWDDAESEEKRGASDEPFHRIGASRRGRRPADDYRAAHTRGRRSRGSPSPRGRPLAGTALDGRCHDGRARRAPDLVRETRCVSHAVEPLGVQQPAANTPSDDTDRPTCTCECTI